MSSRPTATTESSHMIEHGKLCVDLEQELVTYDDHTLEINATEFALLTCLVQAAPRVVPFVELAQHIPGYTCESAEDADEALRYHIYRLRRKIKETIGDPELIQTVRAVGYAFSQPSQAVRPSGLITFLFSDIEGSTQLWEQRAPAMQTALERHDSSLRRTFEAQGGYVFKTVGDGFYVAFSQATAAMAAAMAAQQALYAEDWGESMRLRVRMALATGTADEREGDYFGPTLNLTARLLSAGHGGQVLLSQATQAALAAQIPPALELRDLGLRRFKGLRDPQRVFQALVSDLPTNFPPLRTLDPRPSNLPAELTSFVGRVDELQAIDSLLRRDKVRLVTLTGPGGIGKTRLSLQVAASLQDEYEDGVFFVPLATIHDPALIPFTIAHAIGAEEDAEGMQIERLIAYLHSRQLLLVLDNFEQLVETAPLINDLLRGAPHLKVLVTSREELQIYGEHLYPVAPLAVPQPHADVTPALLERYPATALFVQRVQTGDPDLMLTAQDAITIISICATLDGLPLAIELAAARATQFALSELAEQLTDRLGFLNRGPRDLPARQRTLRGLLDWSYELLTREEQVLFARLAVFTGGWAVVSAQTLVTGLHSMPTHIAGTLASLTAKSLLQHKPGALPRFTMLETIREYAWERLDKSGELDAMRQRHAAYYQHFVTASEVDLTGDEQAAVFKALDTDHDNLRAALAWSLEQDGNTVALEMCGVLWRWWAVRSYLGEGRSWLTQALAHVSAAPAPLRAKALWGVGRLAYFQADYTNAHQWLVHHPA